uniref:Uncharacterized protein n=1 Tax=uncultured organism TaxID=155900 RepID=A0A7L9QBU4_9ZZZZ|nr:hypothetical protein [uncultured organism]
MTTEPDEPVETVTEWRNLKLRADRYGRTGNAGWLPDDGLIDEIAIARVVTGAAPRLTLREAVVAVYELNRRGYDDGQIGARFGLTPDWAHRVRTRHDIPPLPAHLLAQRARKQTPNRYAA